jgi:uncharacterized protein (DUF924 family)
MAALVDPEDVLSFWIGPLDADGLAAEDKAARWFQDDEDFDEMIRDWFEETWRAAMRGQLEGWKETPRGRLAYVILLDQLSRNMFRDRAEAFDGDARALSAAQEAITLGHDAALSGDERVFLYMPFMHAEKLSVQDQSVALFETFCAASRGRLRERLENNLDFAKRHRAVVAQWGRFPQRNASLGRTCTGAELAFLSEPDAIF